MACFPTGQYIEIKFSWPVDEYSWPASQYLEIKFSCVADVCVHVTPHVATFALFTLVGHCSLEALPALLWHEGVEAALGSAIFRTLWSSGASRWDLSVHLVGCATASAY